jgi:uncharacterized membrane protein
LQAAHVVRASDAATSEHDVKLDTTTDLHDLTERAATTELATELASRLDAAVPDVLRQGSVADLLRGRGFGHALHPVLTDVPLGMWTSSTILDVVGGGRWRQASIVLSSIGFAAVVPTIASGLAEWEEVGPHDRRTAALHAAANGAASVCFGVSLVAKLRRRSAAAAAASALGAALAGVGGYLGGHLSFARGVGDGHR